jgi:DNA modification methylase
MCGDSTSIDAVDKLMNGNAADMVFTDPPYNVSFNGRSGKHEVIKNDNLPEKEFERFVEGVCHVIHALQPKASYVWCNWKFYGILQERLPYNACIVWAKNVFGMGIGYRHQHEFCLFSGKVDEWIKNESDLWEVKKDTGYMHPTQKPVALSIRAFSNHVKLLNVVDLFGGSGSTLIGAEQSGRTCFVMELDPKYCDVIVKRWQEYTGKQAVHADTGEPFDG